MVPAAIEFFLARVKYYDRTPPVLAIYLSLSLSTYHHTRNAVIKEPPEEGSDRPLGDTNFEVQIYLRHREAQWPLVVRLG